MDESFREITTHIFFCDGVERYLLEAQRDRADRRRQQRRNLGCQRRATREAVKANRSYPSRLTAGDQQPRKRTADPPAREEQAHEEEEIWERAWFGRLHQLNLYRCTPETGRALNYLWDWIKNRRLFENTSFFIVLFRSLLFSFPKCFVSPFVHPFVSSF